MREPLVHFLLIGAVIIGVYAALNEPVGQPHANKQIEVSLADVTQLVTRFEDTWRRAPSREEVEGLIEAHIRESILVKEAISLAMDQGDAVIDRRLSQKMTFLIESAAGAIEPTEDDLKAYFEENRADYATAPMIAFEQVFFGETPDRAAIDSALAALAEGADPATLGQQSLLPRASRLSTAAAIDGVFGRGFFDALAGAEVGTWVAPVNSGFGVHGVRVTDRVPGTIPGFDVVRDQVRADYVAVAAKDLSEAIYGDMRAGYDVKLPDEAALESVLQ